MTSIHLQLVKGHWDEILRFRNNSEPVIDGTTYSVAGVIAVARWNVIPQLTSSEAVLQRLEASATAVDVFVSRAADSMYGTTTGFGGSGNNTRIRDEIPKLQRVLVKGLQAGIIPPPKPDGYPDLSIGNLVMPESWVKGAIVIRINALIKGHSGCRFTVIEALHALLAENITPSPPLRQTISASGDLGPLAYIAGALTGDGKCLVWAGEITFSGNRELQPSPVVLKRRSMKILTLLPKEGLSIVNGTAPSCSVSALALHDTHFIALLSQATTAMAVEALLGSVQSFDPFLSDLTVRPHPGQIEVAANILRALQGSQLTKEHEENLPNGERLRQDRYSLRTAPQWIGPQIEELISAHRTILIEINSATDNPIIDPAKRNLCGGNFQGTSLTIAMEKVRMGLQHIGRIAYAQMVELGSPSMNRGLAPDLAANEPSLDYGQKALDMACAAYLAELSFVSNTVSNHVQPAEMHNQSVNSLALVSARYTLTAVTYRSLQILASLLLSLCQASDLRSMYRRYFILQDKAIREVLTKSLDSSLPQAHFEALCILLQAQARSSFCDTCSLDTHERFHAVCKPLISEIMLFLGSHQHQAFDAPAFIRDLGSELTQDWKANRQSYFKSGTASDLLGSGTQKLYRWVREDLGVPMRCGIDIDQEEMDMHVSRVYEGIVRGDVNTVLLDMFV
ncbi:phenylalanine ammonia-lyase [Mycena floridula]|nr:phenylalanine ammonia-lyase [Mycena floridula]